jgi:acyl carrier protein
MASSGDARVETGAREPSVIEAWIVGWLAKELRIDAATIDPREPLVNFGLGSRQAILLSGDLSDWLGLDLDPSLAWEHPTIERLAAFVAAQAGRPEAGSPAH